MIINLQCLVTYVLDIRFHHGHQGVAGLLMEFTSSIIGVVQQLES